MEMKVRTNHKDTKSAKVRIREEKKRQELEKGNGLSIFKQGSDIHFQSIFLFF